VNIEPVKSGNLRTSNRFHRLRGSDGALDARSGATKPAISHPPDTRVSPGTDGLQTHRWRKVDSNPQSRCCERPCWAFLIGTSEFQVRHRDDSLAGFPTAVRFAVGPRVRIRLAPAESRQTFGSSSRATRTLGSGVWRSPLLVLLSCRSFSGLCRAIIRSTSQPARNPIGLGQPMWDAPRRASRRRQLMGAEISVNFHPALGRRVEPQHSLSHQRQLGPSAALNKLRARFATCRRDRTSRPERIFWI
jgi:hypothetical protein